MTFAKIPAAVKGEGGANGEASGANGGGNVQNAELAARQEKAAKQTNARKRRLLGVRCHPCCSRRTLVVSRIDARICCSVFSLIQSYASRLITS